jgi:dTDP-glucose 4,6-dehydratase
LAVVQAICDYLDECSPRDDGLSHHSAVRHVPDRPGHDYRYAIDPGKVEREIGWRAEETFDSGLRKTIDWYIAHESWWRPLREKRYDGERLGLLVSSLVGHAAG